jgi:ketosteroid isomerase-like protein
MKQFLATGVIVVLSLGGMMAKQAAPAAAKPAPAAAGKSEAAPAGAKSAGTVSQTLMDLEQQWNKASKAGDADALASLLADDIAYLDSDGTMRTKSEVLARTKKAKWTTMELSDMKVTTHGNTAVVTGSWTGKGTDGAGKAVDGKEHWADTWVKQSNGKWQCVSTAAAEVK